MTAADDIEYPVIVVVTVIVAGIVSGLNLSLFSLDISRLKALAMGDGKKAPKAKKVSRLMGNPHWVLVTLLIANAAAVESMPLALNKIVSSELASIAISVVLVLTFGEIIPQALFVSHALSVGSFFAYFVWFLMIVTAPVSLCISFLLDKLIGHRDTQLYRRRELLELIKIQGDRKDLQKAANAQDGGESGLARLLLKDEASPAEAAYTAENGLTEKELRMMMGALKLSDMSIRKAVKTRAADIFSVSADALVDKDLVKAVFESGYSRIPVYEGHKDNVTKYLIAKTLVLTIFDTKEGSKKVKDLMLVNAQELSCDQLLSVAYAHFSHSSGSHLVFVRDEDSGKLYGLFTFDDLLDQMNGTAAMPNELSESFAMANTLRRSLNGTWGQSVSFNHTTNSPTGSAMSMKARSPISPSPPPFSPTMFIERTRSGYQVRSSVRMDGGAVLSSNNLRASQRVGAASPALLSSPNTDKNASPLLNPVLSGTRYGTVNAGSPASSYRE